MRLQRVGQKILTIGNPGLSVISPRGGAAIPWYLAGGVSAANCVAAYQPIGAADYAASKVNLANPGTFNITEKNAGVEPSWSAENGWYTSKRSDDPMLYATLTGLTLAKSWTILVRFSRPWTATGVYLGYCQNGTYWGEYGLDNNHPIRVYWGGSSTAIQIATDYVDNFRTDCISNGVYYKDATESASGGGTGTLANPVFQFMGNNNYASSGTAKIAAVSIYNTTLPAIKYQQSQRR